MSAPHGDRSKPGASVSVERDPARQSREEHAQHIAALPAEVVERIAAGEVIERPASVVRELIDNALDARATSVRVELREGGRRLVRVSDDGAGITAHDLDLACQPHTTSKIAALADLERITTLGFRGEALASIATVAALEIVSATGDDGLAAAISLAPDAPPSHTARARTRGTTVTARDLFATVPARLAVLRGRQAEAQRALAVIRSAALARPDVRFTAVSDGQLALQTPGGTLEAALGALYTSDLARSAIPLGPLRSDGATLLGAIGPRAISFPTREHVVVAVNGRVVANPALIQAAVAGYAPRLRKGRHPLLVVHLSMPPGAVDANVHPAKLHVLLRDEAALARMLREAVAEALGRAPATVATGHIPAAPTSASQHFTRPLQLTLPAPHRRRGLLLGERRAQYRRPPFEMPDALPTGPLTLEPLGQFEDTLIIAHTPAGDLYLVDQHRAHERVLYDRLAAEQRAGGARLASTGHPYEDAAGDVSGQYLLDPVLVELTSRQAELLAPRMGELAALGIECQPFGGSVFLVRALPAVAAGAADPRDLAGALAHAASEDADDWLEHVRASLACRTAIKRGAALSPAEQAGLLIDLCAASAPAMCPHGSPILLRYSRENLTRAFEW